MCENEILEKILIEHPIIPVPTFEFSKLSKGCAGKYVSSKMKIFIDESQIHEEYLKIAIYHEFEHHWQFVNFPEHYLFWESPKNNDFYNLCRSKDCCTVEIDAYTFGFHFGKENKRFLLEQISVQELEKYAKVQDYQSLRHQVYALIKQFPQK